MATGYRIDGRDLEDGYLPLSSIDDSIVVQYEWANESDVLSSEYILPMFSSNRYLKNGQPIKQAVGKVLLKSIFDTTDKPYPQMPARRSNFGVNGVFDERIGAKGQTPHGKLIAAFTTAGTHTIDLSDDGYLVVDGQKTDTYIANERTEFQYYLNDSGILNISALLAGGGGGGAGSGLTYCSAGGGGGGVSLSSFLGWRQSVTELKWKQGNHKFPITVTVGAGGAGGNKQSAGAAGENSSLDYGGYGGLGAAAGGGGGGTNEEAGGAGAGGGNTGYYHYMSTGGAGGTKEHGGGSSTEVECSAKCWGYNKEDMLAKYGVRIHNGGASNGSNYGGGGGASALADGAPANSRGEGVAGTYGAGGSGAGFTAFTSNAGGKGGDGVAYIFY